MSDIPTKTYPPEVLHATIADVEAEQAGATPEESSAVETKGDAMSDALTDEQRALARQFLNPTSSPISPASIGFPEGLPDVHDYDRSWLRFYVTARMVASGAYMPKLLVPAPPMTEDERGRMAWRLREAFRIACQNAATGGAADAEPGHGTETTDEIGRITRAMMEVGGTR